MATRSEPPPVTDGEVDGERVAERLERPSATAAAGAVEAALGRGHVVSLVGECTVEGAGDEGLPPGVRLAILKPGGSLVVHGAGGAAPMLEAAGGLDVASEDDALEVAVTAEGTERRLRFGRVELLVSAGLDGGVPDTGTDDGPVPQAAATGDRHGAIRDLVLADPDRVEPGFRPLATERETPAGPVDVFGRDAEGRSVVVEIKADRAGPAAVGQVDRYVAALRRDLHADAEVRGVLVAPSATERTRRLLEERGYAFRALSPEGLDSE